VKCQLCGKVSRKFDPFLDLSVHIPDKYVPRGRNESLSCTLLDCLEAFVGPETLTSQYYCKSCTSTEPPMKKFTINVAPNVLCVHIKRFRWPNRFKIPTHIDFPQILDLSQFVKTTDSTRYSLYSVITHTGYGTWAGHYTTYCLSLDGGWLLFDDDRVTNSSWEDVQACEAYILFYKLVS